MKTSTRILAASFALTVAVVACGGDAGGDSKSAATQLTADEREWCGFADASEESALRFDIIFEVGAELELAMDTVNAQAAALYDQYLAEGMTFDEAARSVSEQLLEDETFVAACKAAFSIEVGG